MPPLDPKLQRSGAQFLPDKCVTALFPIATGAHDARRRLLVMDFRDEQIELLAGDVGAKQLDVDGEQMSGFQKALQAITQALADDAGYLDRTNAVLKQGGAVVSVDTGDDEATVHRAVAALKAAGGEDIQHWGQWRTEQF